MKNSYAGPDSIRQEMVDDLLRQKLVGMTRKEIEELLGKPLTHGDDHMEEYLYWLGRKRGLIRIGYEYLSFKFKDDVVTDARITK